MPSKPTSKKAAAIKALVGTKESATKTVVVEIVPDDTFNQRKAAIEAVALSFNGNRARQPVAAPGSYRLNWQVFGPRGMNYTVEILDPPESRFKDTFQCDPQNGMDVGLHRFEVNNP